jgi:ABC-type nitrate/sulfonate/bicarbonate transport system permease component
MRDPRDSPSRQGTFRAAAGGSQLHSPRARRLERALPPVLLILGFLTLWEIGVRLGRVNPYILPSPLQILHALLASRVTLLVNLQVTLTEILLGFGLGFAAGVLLAAAIVFSPAVERALYPLIIASQTIPVIAIAPLLVVWFGYGVLPKVIVTALIVFFPITVNAVDGLGSADRDLINLLRTMKATPAQVFFKVRLPAALPYLFSGTKVGITYSVIGAVIGEWVGAQEGIGYLMIIANAQLQTDLIFASILVLSVLGVGLFALVAGVERLTLRWKFAGGF